MDPGVNTMRPQLHLKGEEVLGRGLTDHEEVPDGDHARGWKRPVVESDLIPTGHLHRSRLPSQRQGEAAAQCRPHAGERAGAGGCLSSPLSVKPSGQVIEQ